mgnify:CR=1 FL=1
MSVQLRARAAGDALATTFVVARHAMRNALIPPERGVMRLTLTRTGRRIGAVLRRLVRAPQTRPGIDVVTVPDVRTMTLPEARRAINRAELELAIRDAVLQLQATLTDVLRALPDSSDAVAVRL